MEATGQRKNDEVVGHVIGKRGRDMRVVVLFGYLLGIALPVLETMRRGFAHWLVNSTTMADDYIMGALLLAASVSWSLKE